MNMDAYTVFVRDSFPELPKSLHCALGLASEVGEVLGVLRKSRYEDGPFEEVDLIKLELGDVLFYLVAIADTYGMTLENLAEANMTKLLTRRRLKREGTPK